MPRPAKQPANPAPDDAGFPPFEQSLEELERIVRDIEEGNTPLEESIQKYERGTKLLQHCRAILDRVETRIKTLTVEGSPSDSPESDD